ncbi:hypothetical protein [Leptolyngbya iicbica]|uniref:Uncharacterized protein n=2 Tax=Cyanophyceae TaxID=3028117 RepID=A0A4Q7E9N4_9CYAN|nr:hypothetical protein [Leptolyngbya sp. LK]RZM79139.1 hypothetical protein DYY88_10295 [Leptolyngbya sp. LK]
MTGLRAAVLFRELRTAWSSLEDIRYERRNLIPARQCGMTGMGWRRSYGGWIMRSLGIEMTGLKAAVLGRALRIVASALADIRYERWNSIPSQRSGITGMGWGRSYGGWIMRSPGIEMTGLKAAVLGRALRIVASALADIRCERRNSVPTGRWRTAS